MPSIIALVSVAPQWIDRMLRSGMGKSMLEDIADEVAVLVGRAMMVR